MTVSQPTLLFIGSQFFGYERDITAKLMELGWHVDYYSDCPPNKFLFKVLKKLAPALARQWCDDHFGRLFKSIANKHYDKVFVLKGEGITRRTALQLRRQTVGAPISLYMWDSVKNLPFGIEKLDVFDRVMSFDPVDAAQWPKIEHYPLFFVETFTQSTALTQDIDLFFVGTLRPDRYQLVNNIRQGLPKNIACKFRFYVQRRIMYEIGRVPGGSYRGSNPEEFIFKPINKANIAALMARSRVIIDVEHAQQTGLTMRTFETLGAGRKLATTNAHIRDYDFYDPRNICVLDRTNPTIPVEFIRSPVSKMNREVIDHFSLSCWLENVALQ